MTNTFDADDELRAIRVAYDALKPLRERHQWQRAMDYLGARLVEDGRGAFLARNWRSLPEATQYVLCGNLDERFVHPDEAVRESDRNQLEIVEVNGIAIVSQQFAIEVPVDDGDGGTDGREIMWFDTRAAAESYLTEIRTTSSEPEDTADV